MGDVDIKKFILCECGDFIEGRTFKAYIETSIGPSTPTVGHTKCGLIFDFIDGDMPKTYSSKKELKILAQKFAVKNDMDSEMSGKYLLEVDRLKSHGNMSDSDILIFAYKKLVQRGDCIRRSNILCEDI